MKAFVITIKDHKYSEQSAKRCIDSGNQFGIDVTVFNAVTPDNVDAIMTEKNLRWNWANQNTKKCTCPITGIFQIPYRSSNLKATMSCSMSHYLLWEKCVELDESIIIMEHDAFFITQFPKFEFKGAVQICDPRGKGEIGKEHYYAIVNRDTEGVHPLTVTTSCTRNTANGFSGNSAYVVKPWAAKEFISAYHKYGVWPNDATICIQLFPWLEEYYPFITQYKQTLSTSTR